MLRPAGAAVKGRLAVWLLSRRPREPSGAS